ncbi:MAG: ATP-binding protein [Thermodesulfobacteriota bacterium]|jgi:light-regulated signal transduction histidine kinase (bacteriophytochrome)
MKGNLALEDRSRARTFRDLVIISVTAVLAFAIAYVFNLFEMIADLSRKHVGWNIDEFIIVLAILAFAFGIFSLRRWRELKDEIAERRRAEKEIKKLNEDLERRTIELEATNNELEAFSYSVSHDLRNPVLAIGGFSRLLLEKYSSHLDEKGHHYLNIILSSTQNMCQFIDDILAFSHSGHRQIEFSDIDMGELAKALFEELKGITLGRMLRLNLKPLPPARCDRAMIREVLMNLLSNAIKFTRDKETGIIEMSGWIEKNQNIYYVKDNGAGFDMQNADKLFGVFQRLHNTEEFEGTGVGLALVQRIIYRHGGRVWAVGKVNEGATFFFSLPR